ncbi:GNAT family N-acetyltransferase [Nonomuraea sediminis]|uniref:GNAT family N-acetyltransferase n=1 Tax=Nonomuraea sediminis TaxID=2835864 RepID=UPI00202A92FC|nr:GNAT family N-acetyltransferase [Nonomuraea sediminis]
MRQAVRTVRPEMVRAWVAGWVVSRQAPAPVEEPWGLRVDVGLPGHVARHIVPDPDPSTLRHLTETITTPGTWLKLCAPADAVAPYLPKGWSIQPPEYMMTAPLKRGPIRVPPEYTIAVTPRANVTVARLLTHEGEIASRGQIAIAGRHAVVDQVETAPAHRRRGLGRVVMTALSSAAATRTGVLVATPEGAALYSTLGWTHVTDVTAAVFR